MGKSVLTTAPGTGILVNLTDSNHPGQDLISTGEYGDLDMELDFMMAPGSNSGIYLQGRYEIRLLDSWGVINATAADNGGIYERWDESRPEGQKGYQGHAPRQNASRAPGLWQHMEISFQAPRFNAVGQKIENARILSIVLNGVTIQENVQLSGPTRGAISNDDVPLGPLRLQGDHGPVAFRNIKIVSYDHSRPEFTALKYAIFNGSFDEETRYKSVVPEAQGTSPIISLNVHALPKVFLIRYTGMMQVKEPGEYQFGLRIAAGRGFLKIKDQSVINLGEGKGRGTGKAILPAGEFPFELVYSKLIDYAKPSLGLTVKGPGIREFVISDANVGADNINPILVDAPVNTILRSFVDVDSVRVTHAVNVGSALQVHYTYDLDKGMIVQLWRGDFLDATPMWRGRGDGSSRALGMVLRFGKPALAIGRIASPDAAWPADTVGSGYRPKGYVLDDSDRPAFRYIIYNTAVNDLTRVLSNSHGIHREISIQSNATDLYLKLAEANTIETVSDGLYLINDKSYYLRIDEAGNAKPVIRDVNGHKEMIMPIRNKISYYIFF